MAIGAYAKCAPDWRPHFIGGLKAEDVQANLLDNKDRNKLTNFSTLVGKVIKELNGITGLNLGQYNVDFGDARSQLKSAAEAAKLTSAVVAGCSLLYKKFKETNEVSVKQERCREW